MTRQETNAIIKQVWTEHLQRQDSIPEDLANGFSTWVQMLIRKAAPLLKPGVTNFNEIQPAAQEG